MPLQPALTNGSVKTKHVFLKWSIIILATIWVLAIARVTLFGGSSHTKIKTAAAPVATTVAPGTATTVPGAAPAPSPDQAIDQAVQAFVPAWLAPGTPDQRQAALAPVTTPDLLAQLVNVPPDALPQAQLAGDPEINSEDPSTAIATASLTDGTFVAMRLVQSPSGDGSWLVSDLDTPSGPASAPAPAT